MYDINRMVTNPELERTDPEGHMAGLEHWSPIIAQKVAQEEGIVLEEEHWQVIYCLRERYRSEGPARSARELMRLLERDFSGMGGRQHLYTLFPRGPIAQACRIAGLPLPPGTLDASFGSVH